MCSVLWGRDNGHPGDPGDLDAVDAMAQADFLATLNLGSNMAESGQDGGGTKRDKKKKKKKKLNVSDVVDQERDEEVKVNAEVDQEVKVKVSKKKKAARCEAQRDVSQEAEEVSTKKKKKKKKAKKTDKSDEDVSSCTTADEGKGRKKRKRYKAVQDAAAEEEEVPAKKRKKKVKEAEQETTSKESREVKVKKKKKKVKESDKNQEDASSCPTADQEAMTVVKKKKKKKKKEEVEDPISLDLNAGVSVLEFLGGSADDGESTEASPKKKIMPESRKVPAEEKDVSNNNSHPDTLVNRLLSRQEREDRRRVSVTSASSDDQTATETPGETEEGVAERSQISQASKQTLKAMNRKDLGRVDRLINQRNLLDVDLALDPEEMTIPAQDPPVDLSDGNGSLYAGSFMCNFWKLPRLCRVADPLAHKVTNWILSRDFPLTPLNMKTPKKLVPLLIKEADALQKEYPAFLPGRFTTAEDAVIIKRLKVMVNALQMSPKDCLDMGEEFRNLRKGENRSTAKLVLGAYLGRPLLERRRCIDIYRRFEAMVSRAAAVEVLGNPGSVRELVEQFAATKARREEGQASGSLGHDFKQGSGVSGLGADRLATAARRAADGGLRRRSTFDHEEIAVIVRFLVNTARRRGVQVTELGKGDVDWFTLSLSFKGRSAKHLRSVWSGRIKPVIATHLAGEFEPGDKEWQVDMLEAILDDHSIVDRRLINYNRLSAMFPEQNGYSIRRVLDQFIAKNKQADSFREALEQAVDHLRYKRQHRPSYTEATRDILKIYQEVVKEVQTTTE